MVKKSRWDELLAEMNGEESPGLVREREIEELEKQQKQEEVLDVRWTYVEPAGSYDVIGEHVREAYEQISSQGIRPDRILVHPETAQEIGFIPEPADPNAVLRGEDIADASQMSESPAQLRDHIQRIISSNLSPLGGLPVDENTELLVSDTIQRTLDNFVQEGTIVSTDQVEVVRDPLDPTHFDVRMNVLLQFEPLESISVVMNIDPGHRSIPNEIRLPSTDRDENF